MPHADALVLTANPATGALDEAVAARARSLVTEAAAARWIAPGAAFEVIGRDVAACASGIRAALGALPIDVNVVPADPGRRAKSLLVADMESTIIEQELIDELAAVAGRREEIAAITLATMRGELDFQESIRHRGAALAGLTAADLDSVARRITLTPGAARLVSAMNRHGATTALVSGGFTIFMERVARNLGFDRFFGNGLEIEKGRLTGRVAEPILDAAGKRSIFLKLAGELGRSPAEAVAVGDGANDLAMLSVAGLGVAYHAKPGLRDAMGQASNGAVIDHADLTAVLHLQGLTG